MNRVLVIRGGAIGDFVLTLPAIKLLRDDFPQAHIEILGYQHIIALAERRFYADAIRSIEYGPLARFFAKGSALPAELTEYFGSFDLIVSYLFDSDKILQNNLKRCGIKMFIAGPPKLSSHEHAALQLARPLEEILARFREERARFVARLEAWDEERLGATSLHPRLNQPMRVVDMAYFVAEHDDHHLARMTGLARSGPTGISAPARTP